jgi:hypothetical protein
MSNGEKTYPALFDVCHTQDWTFEKVLSCNFTTPLKRRLFPSVQGQWEYIINCVVQIGRPQVSDSVVWSLVANKRFYTKYVYRLLEKDVARSNHKWIWKANIHQKI